MYHQAQERDEVCTKLWEYCKMGWPRKQLIPLNLTPYWKARNSLTICNDLLVYNSCIVLLRSLQRETLQKIHSGHLGIENQETYCNISMVARSDAPGHSTCAELQSMYLKRADKERNRWWHQNCQSILGRFWVQIFSNLTRQTIY